MNAIGGYFELELRHGTHYHSEAIRLNSARNCFEYILRARKYQRVYMPYYTCQVMFDTAQNIGVEIAYYALNGQLEPIEYPVLHSGEAFLYTNYYGLKQDTVLTLASHYGQQLIVDNAQAFYANPIQGIDTFYSPHKFFGVPDGGYLYTDSLLDIDFPQAKSLNRMMYLLKRIEQGAESGYHDFQQARETLKHRPIERMSKITEVLLESIDYNSIAQQRKQNYLFMQERLCESNIIYFPLKEDAVPMVYPYLTKDGGLRQRLIDNKVYVAVYWPTIDSNCLQENLLKNNLLPLPIDQRYSNLDTIINIIKHE